MRKLLALLLLLVVAAGLVWFLAGRADGPVVSLTTPTGLMGQRSPLQLTVHTPDGGLTALDVAVEQGGQRLPVGSMDTPAGLTITRAADRVDVTGEIGRATLPTLKQGPATIVVRATRPVLFGARDVSSESRTDVQVRLTPPTLAPLSQFHFINQGGAELVIYQVTPADASSGVRVGDKEYPGAPAAGAGIVNAAPGVRVAFFPFLYNQTASTLISLWARDAAGNEGRATFDTRVFPKRFRTSTIPLEMPFLQRVVPAILQNTPDLQVEDPSDLLASYLVINRDLRRQNNQAIAQIGRTRTSQTMLWSGPFRQMVNSAVEAGFADDRTYLYEGKTVDRQVHLGFDLASTQQAPVQAANRGKVVFAGYLGIYGNCVILDHGLGLQSLYAHLSAIGVQEGQDVEMNAPLGSSGVTGLAGGDHLHFTMLLHGEAVSPVDWWSAQWVEDRILRKLRAAGRPLDATPPVS